MHKTRGRVQGAVSFMPKEKRPSILTVEDDAAIGALITGVLSSHFDMHTAGSGAAGLAIAADTLPDLILLDLGLPDVEGHDLLARWRSSGVDRCRGR